MLVTISNVLLLDNVDPGAKTILEENGIKATLCKGKSSADELIKTLQDYDGMVVRSATRVTSSIIENCPKLKIIGRAGVGVDNIDVKSATRHGVIVMNTPSGNTISAAEHTCTLICCLSRNVPAADASMKAEKWDRKAKKMTLTSSEAEAEEKVPKAKLRHILTRVIVLPFRQYNLLIAKLVLTIFFVITLLSHLY